MLILYSVTTYFFEGGVVEDPSLKHKTHIPPDQVHPCNEFNFKLQINFKLELM